MGGWMSGSMYACGTVQHCTYICVTEPIYKSALWYGSSQGTLQAEKVKAVHAKWKFGEH